MKKITILIAAAIVCMAAMPLPSDKANITLKWDHPAAYPLGNPAWNYRIYQSTNGVDWVAITNVSGLSNSVVLPVVKSEAFFYATTVDATNFWNESLPSNAVQVPAPPPNGENLSVSRGPK